MTYCLPLGVSRIALLGFSIFLFSLVYTVLIMMDGMELGISVLFPGVWLLLLYLLEVRVSNSFNNKRSADFQVSQTSNKWFSSTSSCLQC